MAEILDTFPERRGGRPEIYPWDEWMDGRARRLKQGKDFQGKSESFRVLVHRKAKDYGMKAKTSVSPDGTKVTIQFYDPNAKTHADPFGDS